MAREFKLPDLGEGIHEGEIIKVLVAVGDQVKEDQPILEVETDKATVEIPSPFGGTVSEIRVNAGDIVSVGDVLLVFDGEGAAATEAQRDEPARDQEDTVEQVEATFDVQPREEARTREVPEEEAPAEKRPREKPAEARPPAADQEQPVDGGRQGPVPAAPSTRRLARELGVDLRQVRGSGPGGRVTAEDVRGFAEDGAKAEPAGPPEEEARREPRPADEVAVAIRSTGVPVPALPDFQRWGEVERVPLRSVRRATAKHMALAWSQIPHVSHQDVADVTELEALRNRYKGEIAEQGGSLSLTVFVLKAVVAALKAHPRFNASLDTDAEEIVLKKHYHLGVAVDTERGLLVPIIRDVDRKSMAELAVELKELVQRTRDGKIELEEMQGGTFTITNPGPLGGTAFAPIVNYPEVAILGMAKASWQPVVQGQGAQGRIVPRLLMPLILAFDHRVVDGADAARFVTMVIQLLEAPDRLLITA
jgi:pyruvate dehydrogenase E2 component (dihydrolipoamide acetyltransferase)